MTSRLLVLCVLLFSPFTFAGELGEKILDSSQYLEDVTNDHLNKDAQYIDTAIGKATTQQSKFLDKLDQFNINIGIDEMLDLFDGFGLGLGYKYGVGPAYIGDYYVREDSYKLKVQVNPFEWFMDDAKPWVFKVEPGTEIKFWQLFPTAAQARKVTNGYSPARFPLSADKAEKYLKPGDMAHLRAYLNLNVGARDDWDLVAGLEARGSIIYTISGYFDIFIFRADENKVRLRIIGRRARGLEGKAELGVEDDFEIFGWEVVDNAIVNFTHLEDFVMQKISNKNQNIFVGDYVLNLDYPEVKAAYNEVFSKALKFKDQSVREHPAYSLWNPRKSASEVSEKFVSDLTQLDEIYRQDLEQKDTDKRRVDRIFAGTNQSKKSLISETRLGITGIYRTKQYSARRNNGLSLLNMQPDGSQTTDYYFFPSWTRLNDRRALINYYREQTFRNATMIYNADENYKPTNYLTSAFYYEYLDKVYENNEHKNTLNHFKRVLPEIVYNDLITELRKRGFDSFQNNIENVRVSARYFLHALGLDITTKLFGQYSNKELVEKMRSSIVEHLKSTPSPDRNYAHVSKSPKAPAGSNRPKCSRYYKNMGDEVRNYCTDIDKIAPLIAAVVSSGLDAEKRHEAMDELSDNHLFQQIGPGLLFRLIPPADLAQATFFELKFYLPKKIGPIYYVYPHDGVNPYRELFESILDIQDLMDNLTPDMRLNGKEDNLTTRKTEGGGLH